MNKKRLPILHSRDLVNWRIVGYALQELTPDDFFDRPQHGNGVYAPCIRYRNGTFYIYWGDPDFGIYMVKTNDPAGRWDAPVPVKPDKGDRPKPAVRRRRESLPCTGLGRQPQPDKQHPEHLRTE